MHASLAFRLLGVAANNFIDAMPPQQYKYSLQCYITISSFMKLHALIVDLILSTDMARHTEILGSFKSRTTVDKLNLSLPEACPCLSSCK